MRIVIAILVLTACVPLHAQQIPRDGYLDLLPPMPKLIGQTRASVDFHLYGDRQLAEYRDANFNGIDDTREVLLHDIADRFSPVLRRNNFSIPLNFRRILGEAAIIHVDTWESGKLIDSAQVPLFGGGLKASTNDAGDSALTALVQRYMPSGADVRYVKPEDRREEVMFVDFPGSDPKSWRETYKGTAMKDATSYVHFFLHADTLAPDGTAYYLIAQYWLFYPFNDAANNHEGDWERINVGITIDSAVVSRDRAELKPDDVRALLSGKVDVTRLRIAFVDYFFHESFITLDYLPAYRPLANQRQRIVDRVRVWRDTSFASRVIRERTGVAQGALATHPIGYIGGNNKGPDELLTLWPRFRGSYNRNSNGTYPFPGIWHAVGPMGSTEHLPGVSTPELGGRALSREELVRRLAEAEFVAFEKQNLILVPDWERIEPLLETNIEAQNNWSWLVLPLRWGYPASKSPGAGAIKHVDVGNIAPEGPPFQPGWNRVGSPGWRRYDADVLRVMLAPRSPFDKMTSGWGFLNLPAALFGTLPGWNVIGTQLMPWISGSLHLFNATLPRTFTPRNAPQRFTSLTAGTYRQTGGNEFALLLPGAEDEVIQGKVTSSNAAVPRSSLSRAVSEGYRIGMAVHYGAKLTIENTYSSNESTIGSAILHGNGERLPVSASIKTRDLTGGFRYSVAQSTNGAVQAFLKAGYGWTWYDVRELVVDGSPTEYDRRSGYAVTLLPSKKWWPNTWYGGAGVEIFTPRRAWLLQQFGYGVRAEFTTLKHRVGARSPGAEALASAQRNDFSVYAVMGW